VKREAIRAGTNPNYLFLSYDRSRFCVTDLFAIPRHFVSLSVIDCRKQLSETARRRGWIGSIIRLDRLPPDARVPVVQNREPVPKNIVLREWAAFGFLRDADASARGWLGDVLYCVRRLERQAGKSEFSNDDIYAFEGVLKTRHPGNMHVRAKIRQQLQVLISRGFLERLGTNRYRTTHPVGWTQSELRAFLERTPDAGASLAPPSA
jgi:type II restriction enzyme